MTLTLAGCASTLARVERATSTAATGAPAPSAVSAPHSCHARPGPLPDPACTPGATNPAVTQADIATTICTRGWTATVRPPESYTEQLKRRQVAAYGYTDARLRDYEEDHLVPLELGGAPSDPKNLWPEPGASPNSKDDVESALNHAVCSGRVGLAAAQRAIAANWLTAEHVLGLA